MSQNGPLPSPPENKSSVPARSSAFNDGGLDYMISRLLTVTNTDDKTVNLDVNQIYELLRAVLARIQFEPMCLQVTGPIHICGDIHGQYGDLLNMFGICSHPPETKYLFLGDYVDRGKNSIETICLLFCYKLKYPTNFFLLRGNHECMAISHMYGFYDECKRRYEAKLWKVMVDIFNSLPIAAIIENQLFCCHGGLPKSLATDETVQSQTQLVDKINDIVRPDKVEDSNVIDLLWADPHTPDDGKWAAVMGWKENVLRGISHLFGPDVIETFCSRFNIQLIIRAHQVVEQGYEFYKDERKLVTIFSAPNYCGEFENRGAVFILTKDKQGKLEGSFKQFYGYMDKRNPGRRKRTNSGVHKNRDSVDKK